MYEHRDEKLLPFRDFRARAVRHGAMVAGAIAVALGIGILGYHWLGGLAWIDALVNASMILGGMGAVDPITTVAGKLFASGYAIFSGLFFLAASAVLVAPWLHRLLHRFHIEQKGKGDE